jgi:hypothetical protein
MAIVARLGAVADREQLTPQANLKAHRRAEPFGGRKILLATLWKRTSAAGNPYLSGFLGKASIVGFRGEPRPDGTPTWDIYIEPGREQEEAREQRPRDASGADRSHQRRRIQRWLKDLLDDAPVEQPETKHQKPRPGKVQRWRPDNPASDPPADKPPAEDRPFHDDSLADLWREGES